MILNNLINICHDFTMILTSLGHQDINRSESPVKEI